MNDDSRILKEYEIIEKISEGSFGVVYKVTKKSSNKTKKKFLALKEMTNLPKRKEIIDWEIEIHTKLDHKNVIRVLDHEETKTNIFLLMDFCPMTLNKFIQQNPYPLSQ